MRIQLWVFLALLVGLVVLTIYVLVAYIFDSVVRQYRDWRKNTITGREAYERGDYAEAEERFKEALKHVSIFGPTSNRLVESFKNFAKLYPNGVYALMTLALEDAVKKEKVQGLDHPEAAQSFERLSWLYSGLKVGENWFWQEWRNKAWKLYRKLEEEKE